MGLEYGDSDVFGVSECSWKIMTSSPNESGSAEIADSQNCPNCLIAANNFLVVIEWGLTLLLEEIVQNGGGSSLQKYELVSSGW